MADDRSTKQAERRHGIGDRLMDRLDGRGIAPAARRVIDFIDRNRATALASSAVEIAAGAGTSDATVVRAAQALGFAGLGDLKQALAASLDGPSTSADDLRRTLADVGHDASRAVDLVIEAHDDAMAILREPGSRARIAAAVARLHPAERIALFGVGPSGTLACYAAMLLGRAGRRTLLLDRTGRMLADQLLDLRPGDALLALSYGRPYREIATTFAEACRLGLPTVLITDSAAHKLAGGIDVVLAIPRGRAERVALHGATLVGLEALVLGLTFARSRDAVDTLDRLDGLRSAIVGR